MDKSSRPVSLPLAGLFLLSGLLLLPSSMADGRESEPVPMETGVIKLEHVETKVAVTLLRSILQVRQMAEIVDTRTVVIQETPEVIEIARRLIREIDVPALKWSVDLVLKNGKGEQVIRTVDLDQEPVSLSFGTGGPSQLSITLEASDRGPTELRTNYRIVTQLAMGDSEERYNFSESALAVLAAEDRLVLLEPALHELKRELARVLGVNGEVSSLALHFHRNG